MTITCDSPTTHFDSGCELLLAYDTDNDGVIIQADAMRAYNDQQNGVIEYEEYRFVVDAFDLGSIDALCPGCYSGEDEVITCDSPTTHFNSGCELLLNYDIGGDGVIGFDDWVELSGDYGNGVITQAEYDFVMRVYDKEINTLCSGCYSEDGEAIFRVIEFTVPTSCVVPCNIDIHIKWQNVGTANGSFVPKYEINGIPYTDPQQTLAPNTTYTLDDIVSITSVGTYEICPYPNE